ncbi:hypothetical protein CALVIDRAFT_466438, partial [Calocera viscosa TUFC12733]
LSVSTAALVGLFTSSILYGIYLVLFVGCLYVLLKKWGMAPPNHILVSASIAMFVINTTIVALSFSRVQDAFLLDPSNALNLAEWKELTRTMLTCVYMILADSLLIYRCWIVWKRQLWVIAAPITLLIACSGMIIMLLRAMALSTESAEGIFAPSIAPWITAVLVLTLVQNLLVTCLIVYRILKVNSSVSGSGGRTLRPIIAMILESGALYVVTLFIWLMTYVAHSFSEYILVDCINPAIGITYFLLIIRV